MARAGTTIHNPVAGDSVTFVETVQDGSPRLVCDMTTLAGGQGPPEHIHPSSAEAFEVLEGAVVVELDGTPRTLETGESLTVPAGRPHRFFSAPDRDGRVRVSFDHPGRMEDFLVTFYELARAGRTAADGKPSMPQIAASFSQLTDDIRTTIAPWPAQRAMFLVLGPVAKLRGLKPFYEWEELG